MKTIRHQLLALGFACLLAALTVPPAEATANLHFQRLSLAEGLSQTTVNSVLQDHHGFMWFGTLEGLNRFDGYDFKVYQHDPADSTSLSQDTVRSLVEDEDGILWIGTDKGGLNRFDEARGTFTHYRHDPEDPHSLSHDRIRVMAFDPDGILWIGTDGGGLNRFDPLNERFTRFPFETTARNSLGHPQVRALHVASDGRIWIGTDGGGLAVLDPTTGEFDHHRHDGADSNSLLSDNVYTIYEDRAGALWVGTGNGGAHRFEPETGSFTRIETPGTSAVRTILHSREDRLLVGTDDGLWVWDRRDGTHEAYRHDSANLYSLSHDRVTSLFQDLGGVIWIGTFNGLNKWNPTAGAFATFRSEAENPSSLSQSYVTSFAEEEDGAVWIGTMGGINRFDRETGRFERFQHDPADPGSLADNRVMSLLRDSGGRVWAGMIGGGLGRLDPATGRFTTFKNQPGDETSLSFNGVTAIFEDRFGTLWVGTYRGGLNRWRPESESFVRYRHDSADPASLSSDRVVALYEDQRGTLWIGTDGGGLNRYERRLDAFVSYRYDPTRATSLSSDHAWTITEGTDGDLWIGTQGGGLNRWTLEDRRADQPVFQRFLKKDGLLSSTIYATLWDGEGNLWLSSNRGISAFAPESGLFRHYNTSHGLQSDEFNFAAALRTADGSLFFGGVDGFNVFDPETIQVNEHLPPVVLTSFLKFNQPVAFDRPTAELESLEIGHEDSVITFEFAGLDYTAPEKNRYRYILEGFDRDWVEIGRRNRVTYTNLDPGRYTLRVQASNNDGRWNRQGLTIAVTAAPPPWATWWAYSSYAFIAFVIGAVFVSDQKNRQRRALALEKANEDLQLEIFERQRAEGELSKLSLAVEQSPASVIITDREGRIDYVNPNFVEVTGYSRDEVRGRSLDLLRSGYASDAQNQELWRCIEAGEAWRGEVHSRKKSGEMFWEEASVSPILGPDGKISHLLAINEDLTVRKQYELRLLRQAHYDHLTHLPNRTLALDRLSRAIARTRAEGNLVAVMFLDLDNFKIVNDTMGHAAGDQLLKITASRLHTTVRDSDTVARLGGDEFLFILGDLAGLVEVESAARRILDCFAEPISVDGREIFVTASLGITIAPNDSDEPQVLLRNADAAMYRAKEAGRDAYQFFTPAMNEHAVARLQLESNLRQALQRRELFLEYQPLVLADGGEIVGAEALLRWRNPRLGRVSPGDFIPVAEDTGLIVPIGEWVLDTACREARNWSLPHGEQLRIAVNISARQLRADANLVDTVKQALKRSGLPPEDLELEVTEGVLLDDRGEAAAILEDLHEMGVRLSIDDFGTGYSSLRYLRQFPFDVLKIDRSFVQDLLGSQGNSPLVRAIIAMAGGLGLEVVGEGVETQTQLALLRAMGCHLVQGFLFSRPVPGRTLARMLAQGGQLDHDEEEQETEEEEPFRPRLVAG